MQYNKLGDSDLLISEITLGTMTFGEQNTEKEAHDMLSYSFDQGINILDTAEMYPVPTKKETQGRTDLYIGSWMQSKPRDKVILATKVSGYSERSSHLRDNTEVLRVDAVNIKESVEKSLSRLKTDYIDLLQIHWPDRYVAIFGSFAYDSTKWRPSVPFEDQLKAFQELIDEGKVRYIGVSNETSYGVMEFVHAAKLQGLPKIEATNEYVKLAKKHGLTPVQLALGFVRDRPFTASTIIGATTMDQLKENIDAFTSAPRPLPPPILDEIETLFKKYKDPAIL
ncbi:unnamed protein product [Alopecurus aequalis]